MDKSKIADKEIEVAKWMNKKGYDRRASKDIAPIIVEYLREFKLLDLHIVSQRSELLAFAKEMQKIGFNEMDDAEAVVDIYLKANCG
jgi:hypothetical protein